MNLIIFTGIINLIGCIILGTEYSTSQLGWAFYLSVAAGCYILLEVCAYAISQKDSCVISDRYIKNLYVLI